MVRVVLPSLNFRTSKCLKCTAVIWYSNGLRRRDDNINSKGIWFRSRFPFNHEVWDSSFKLYRASRSASAITESAVVGRPFVKRFTMLSGRCRLCMSVTFVHCGQTVGRIKTKRHAGRPRPWPPCVRWGPSSPSPKGHRPPQISAHICCGQMAAWIKISHGMWLYGPGDFVLDGDPAPPLQKGAEPPKFSAHVYCGQTAGWM